MYPTQYQSQQPTDTNPSCLQLMLRQPQFSPHWQAPYPQQLQGAPQSLNQDLPHIANAVGNVVGAFATANPAYTYYFNLVGYQNFQNEEFMKLVEFAARYYLLLVEQRAVANPRDGLNQASEFAVRMMASITVMRTPQLHPFITREIYDACAVIASKMESVIQQFNRAPQGYQASSGYGGGAPTGYGVGAGYGRPTGVLVEPFQPLTPSQSLNPHDHAAQAAAEQMPRGRRKVRAPVAAKESETKQYFQIPGAPAEKPVVKEAPPEPPKAAATVTHMSKDKSTPVTDVLYRPVKSAENANLKWQPFSGQLYLPAYCVHFQKMEMERVQMQDGRTFQNLATIVDLENEEMNRADHAITTAQALYRSMGQTEEPRLGRLASDLNLAARAVDALAAKEDDETTESFRAMNFVESEAVFKGEDSLIGFVTTARVRRLQVQLSGLQKAFTVTGSIVTNFVTDQKLAASLFGTLGEMTTFDGVCSAIKEFLDDNKTEQASALVWRVDRYLRRELLHVIRKRMGLTEFAFDSFIDDQKAVFEVLNSEFGPAYSKALTKYQPQFIRALFGTESLSYAEDETPLVSSEPLSTVTLLDIDYDEFGVRIGDNASHEVFQSNFPGLYDFIRAVVVNNPNVLHHYIITEDDFVYEINRSIVGEEVFLISNGPVLA